MRSKTVSSSGNITNNPTRDIEANPTNVVSEGEVRRRRMFLCSGKYLDPMFLRVRERLEPTEKIFEKFLTLIIIFYVYTYHVGLLVG